MLVATLITLNLVLFYFLIKFQLKPYLESPIYIKNKVFKRFLKVNLINYRLPDKNLSEIKLDPKSEDIIFLPFGIVPISAEYLRIKFLSFSNLSMDLEEFMGIADKYLANKVLGESKFYFIKDKGPITNVPPPTTYPPLPEGWDGDNVMTF